MEGPAFFWKFQTMFNFIFGFAGLVLWFQHGSNYHSNLEFVLMLYCCSNLLNAIYLFRSNICHSPLFLFNLKER
jgi:hypothetical protein